MKKFTLFILSSIFATGAFAASHTGGAPMEAQKQASSKAQAAAEDKHNAKTHGTDKSAKQPQAQTTGNAKSEAAAERKHNVKTHGTDKSAKQPQAQAQATGNAKSEAGR